MYLTSLLHVSQISLYFSEEKLKASFLPLGKLFLMKTRKMYSHGLSPLRPVSPWCASGLRPSHVLVCIWLANELHAKVMLLTTALSSSVDSVRIEMTCPISISSEITTTNINWTLCLSPCGVITHSACIPMYSGHLHICSLLSSDRLNPGRATGVSVAVSREKETSCLVLPPRKLTSFKELS